MTVGFLRGDLTVSQNGRSGAELIPGQGNRLEGLLNTTCFSLAEEFLHGDSSSCQSQPC